MHNLGFQGFIVSTNESLHKKNGIRMDAVLFAVVWGKEATRSKPRKKRNFAEAGERLAPRRRPRRGSEFYHHHRHQKERHPHGYRSFCCRVGQRSHTQQGEEEKRFFENRRTACPEAKAEEGFRVLPPLSTDRVGAKIA